MKLTLRQQARIHLARFRDTTSGVAAVEFALILPILLVMSIGVFEVSRAISVHKRFQRATAMVGDLVAQETAIGTNSADATDQMRGIMYAAEHTIEPFSTSTLKIGVTSVKAASNNANNTTVSWAYSFNGYPVQNKGSKITMPSQNLISKGNSAILVQSQYVYTPVLGGLIPGFSAAMTWTDQITNTPRKVGCIAYAGSQC